MQTASKIYYNRLGQGKPLFLIHGLGERKEGWKWQYPLAADYDLIMPDLRGHGESIDVKSINLVTFAEDILSLMNELQIKRASFCGVSMGGLVVQEIYRQSPERCEGIILANTFHYTPYWARRVVRNTRNYRRLGFPSQYVLNWFARCNLYKFGNQELLERLEFDYQPRVETLLACMDTCGIVDNRSLLENLEHPTLIIGASNDVVTPLWFQLQMHSLVRRSKLSIIKRAGHFARLERPNVFNRIVDEFLKTLSK